MIERRFTLPKEERICSKLLIDKLFGGGSRSMSAFPIRAVYRYDDQGCTDASLPMVRILVSVPKRCFKHAVKRNRVKRQIREAYRKNKFLLIDALTSKSRKPMLVAFIWMDNKLHETAEVEGKVKRLLTRIAEWQA